VAIQIRGSSAPRQVPPPARPPSAPVPPNVKGVAAPAKPEPRRLASTQLTKLADPNPTAPFYKQFTVTSTPLTGVGRMPDRFHVYGGSGFVVPGKVDPKNLVAPLAKLGFAPILTKDGKAAASLWMMTYDKTNFRNKDGTAIGYHELIVSVAAVDLKDPKPVAANAVEAGKLATRTVVLKMHLDHPVPIEAGRIGIGIDKTPGSFEVAPNGMSVKGEGNTPVAALSLGAAAPGPEELVENEISMVSDDVLSPGHALGSRALMQTRQSTRPWAPGDSLNINPKSRIGGQLASLGFQPEAVVKIDELRAGIGGEGALPMSFASKLARIPRVIAGWFKELFDTDLTAD
jgi:hypothetical protein